MFSLLGVFAKTWYCHTLIFGEFWWVRMVYHCDFVIYILDEMYLYVINILILTFNHVSSFVK